MRPIQKWLLRGKSVTNGQPGKDDLVQYPITVIPPNNGRGSDDNFCYTRNGVSESLGGCGGDLGEGVDVVRDKIATGY